MKSHPGVAMHSGFTGTQQFNPDRMEFDLYPTPAEATLALLSVLPIKGKVWECASGMGHISEVLKAKGAQVISTDIAANRYGYGVQDDFLKSKKLLAPTIVTNPPYGMLTEFISHAASLRPDLLVLHIPLGSIFSIGRSRLFDEFGYPTCVYTCFPTLKVQGTPGGKPKRSMFNHAWVVWDKWGCGRRSSLEWLDWRPFVAEAATLQINTSTAGFYKGETK